MGDVRVVLYYAEAAVLMLYPVEDSPECELREVHDENGDAEFLAKYKSIGFPPINFGIIVAGNNSHGECYTEVWIWPW